MSFDSNIFGSGLGGFLGGLFGHSDKPYDKAMEQYQKYMQMGQQTQQPYLNAGQDSIVNYQNWLQNQQNPSQFINNQMANYQESPWAQNMQQQSINSGQNAASASGLMGSTPLMQALQQNAGTIASQDQNNWLQNVLGINSQYGQGQNNLMTGGKNAANALAALYNQMGENMGQAAYGKEAGRNQDFWNTIGGGLNMIKGFGFL
jgi:hypothetical protein